MAEFTELIPQNIAPKAAKTVGVYNSQGQKITSIALGHLAFPADAGDKQYSFGAISDVHLSIDTAESDFINALNFFKAQLADFLCIAGDLTDGNTDAQWTTYKTLADASALTIYPIGGNHDASGSGLTDIRFQQYTGHGTFYTISKNSDIFIMLSQAAWTSVSGGVQPFYTSGLQSLYNSLEANRNKRCFVFIHPFPWGGCGDPFQLYSSNAFFGTQGTLIYSLMSHYKNALWFHGHSHQRFQTQQLSDKANYDFDKGCHSVHIPSVTAPVTVDGSTTIKVLAGSQGYLIDVYADGIHLQGYDFAEGRYLPIAGYWLDTTLQPVEAGTFTDSTGLITT